MKLNHLMALSPDKKSETVTTGFQHLDHLTGGLRTGQICTVAALAALVMCACTLTIMPVSGKFHTMTMINPHICELVLKNSGKLLIYVNKNPKEQ